MTAYLRLGLTLSVVGPRGQLLDSPNWPMALRVTVGTSEEPALADRLALLEKTQPWKLWPDLKDAKVKVRIHPLPAGKPSVIPREVIKPLEENVAFLDALKACVMESGTRLLQKELLTFAFAPGELQDADPKEIGPASVPKRQVPWPGLLATLQSMAAPTPSAMHCIWYFVLPRELLAEQDAEGAWMVKDVLISAAPAEVDKAEHDDSRFEEENTADPYPVHVHKYVGVGTEGHCQALRLKSVLAHQLDEMDNFWLAIRDSSDESLLDLGQRLEVACQPGAPLAVLSVEELMPGMTAFTSNGLGMVDPRPPTPPQATAAIKGWKQRLVSRVNGDELRARLLLAASSAKGNQMAAARAELRAIVFEQFGKLNRDDATTSTVEVIFTGDARFKQELAMLAEERLFPATVRPVTAPSALDGIDLVLGDEALRLRHRTSDDFNAVDDIAQIQLFGRRSSDLSQLDLAATEEKSAKWHALSAAQYQLEASAAISNERLLGATATYIDDVLCRELSYVGSNIACEHPLTAVHRETLDDDELKDESFMLAAPRNAACTKEWLRALPLRYGDYYEFAAAVRDRAGGMAKEVTGNFPWEAALSKIPAMDPPQRDRVQYLRRSAVGDCNIAPGAKTSWPQTPADVALRCMEGLPAQPGKPAPSVIFLVPNGPEFKSNPSGQQPSSYKFRVQAPRTSEHVLMRWNMPETTLGADKRNAAVEALKKDLVTIFSKRDALILASDDRTPSKHSLAPNTMVDVLPVDPAVACVGVRWKFDSGAEGAARFDTGVTEVQVASGDKSRSLYATSFILAEGDYVRLSFHALVAEADVHRFDPRVLEAHLAPETVALWPGFRAFEGSDVYIEAAASTLPAPDATRLTLAEDGQGDIAIQYDFPLAESEFHHVDQVFIASERWVWRNLPIPPEDGRQGDTDRARRLASGPPLELMDSTRRDQSDAVKQFDQLSEIDDGFVGRKDQVLPYPRKAKGPVLLKVDARDGHTHADYLRYSVAFRSRYASVLSTPMSEWSDQRRIATAFRGDSRQLKPPRVLAVLPLMQRMPAPGAKADADAPPFLVLLDEVWFRENGIGERMVARLARVKPEIPETPENPPKELRYGPLPDHRLDVPTEQQLKGLDQLEVFGPFGLSHEKGGSQALANATAFVVYPPTATPPHFNLFVEFARVLDLPTMKDGKSPMSDFTEAVALYTLPDMAQISLGGRGDSRLRLTTDQGGFKCKGADRMLPFPGAQGDVLQGYRYVLVVGHHVRDGGRAVDVFLPADALWLTPSGADNMLKADWLGTQARDVRTANYNAAVVLEIILNGRFPNEHPLSDARDLKQLFTLMLDDGPRPANDDRIMGEIGDALGMIRRVSEWFEVSFESA